MGEFNPYELIFTIIARIQRGKEMFLCSYQIKNGKRDHFLLTQGGEKKTGKTHALSRSYFLYFFVFWCIQRSDHLRRFLKTTFFLVIRLIWRESPSWVSEEAAVWPPTNGLRLKWSGWDPASSGDPTGWAQLGVAVGETKPGKSRRWKLCAGEP